VVQNDAVILILGQALNRFIAREGSINLKARIVMRKTLPDQFLVRLVILDQ
jgi:hypothetical protein